MVSFTVNRNSIAMVVAGVLSLISASLLWNIVTTEAKGTFNGRHHAINYNIFGILALWGVALVSNLFSDAMVKRVCVMMGSGMFIYLVSGVPSDYHTMPITSLGYLHMIRSWVALPFGWDDVKDDTPAWARKAFAGLVLGYMGMLLSFGSLLKFESPPPPLNRSRARKMNQLKMAIAGVTGFCTSIGCICVWSSVVATVPSGDDYKSNPLFFPKPSYTYDIQTYGDFARGKGLTPNEGYGEVMSATGFTIVSLLFVVSQLVSSNEELANVTLIMSSWFGWFLLGEMFELRFEMDGAISDTDMATLTSGYIFLWFAAIATFAFSVVVLTVQSQMAYTRGGPLLPANKVAPVGAEDDAQHPGGLSPISDTEEEDIDDDERGNHTDSDGGTGGNNNNASDDEEEEDEDA